MIKNKYIGPSFDEILKEEGTLEVAELAAIKKVIAEQVIREMKKKKNILNIVLQAHLEKNLK